MSLPDRFEQVGILLGSVILVGLPVSALVSTIDGISIRPGLTFLIWIVPGLVVGLLLLVGTLPVTYHQVWVISLSGWILALVGWTVIGLSFLASNTGLAVIVWVCALLFGVLIAWVRPVSALRRYFHHV